MPARQSLIRDIIEPDQGSKELVKTSEGAGDRAANFMPAGQLAAALARMQSTDEGKEQGLTLQRRYQGSLTDDDLRRVGLSRLTEKGPSLGGRIKGLGGAALDLIDRPSQMMLQGMAGLVGTTDDNVLGGLWGGLSGRGERVNVQNAFGVERGDEIGGFAGGLLNFLGAVAFDPLTYMSLGTSAAAKSGIKVVAKEIGPELAERVARVGFKGLDAGELAQIRSLKAFTDSPKILRKFERSAGGGLQLNVPFGARKKLIGGGKVRAGLANAKIVDQTRAAAKVGGETMQRTGSLQSAARNNPLLSKTRDVFQTNRGELRLFGAQTVDEVVDVLSGAAAKGSHADEAAISTIRRVSKEADKVNKKLDPTKAKEINDGLLHSLDTNQTETFVAHLLSEGLTEHAELAKVLARSLQDAGSLGGGLKRTLTSSGRRAVGRLEGTIGRDAVTRIGEDTASGTFLEANKAARKVKGLENVDVFEENASQIVAGMVIDANRGTSMDDAIRGLTNLTYKEGADDLPLMRKATNEAEELAAKEAGLVRHEWRGEQYFVADEVKSSLKKFEDLVIKDATATDKFLRFTDEAMNMWKVQATVALPFSMGFHSRNGIGNMFLNFLAGVTNPKHYKEAGRIQVEIRKIEKAAAEIAKEGPVTTRRAMPQPAANVAGVRKGVRREAEANNELTEAAMDSLRKNPNAEVFDAWGNQIHIVPGTKVSDEAMDMATNRYSAAYDAEVAAKKVGQREGAEAPRYGKPEEDEFTNLMADDAVKREQMSPSELKITDAEVGEIEELVALKAKSAPGRWSKYGEEQPGDIYMQRRNNDGTFTQRWLLGNWADKNERRLVDLLERRRLSDTIIDVDSRKLNTSVGDAAADADAAARNIGSKRSPLGPPDSMPAGTVRQIDTLGGEKLDSAFEQALKASDLSPKDIETIRTLRDQGVISTGRQATDIDTGSLNRLGSSGQRGRTRRTAEATLTPNWSVEFGSNIGQAIEGNARIAHYLSKIDEGYDTAGAVMSVKKYLFDYSDLTAIERGLFKRVLPFYTFMRKNTPLQFEHAFTTPRKLTAIPRLQQALANTGQDEEYMNGNKPVPSWIEEAGGTFLPDFVQTIMGIDDDSALLGALDMPTAAAFDAVEPFIEAASMMPGMNKLIPDGLEPEERNRGFRGLMGLPGGGVTEILKWGLETGMGQDMFTGQEIKNESDKQFLLRLATSIMPFGAKLNGMTSKVGAESNDRLVATLARSIIGLNLQVVDPQRERSETYRQLDVVQDALDALKNDIGSNNVPTLADLRADGLIPPAQKLGR